MSGFACSTTSPTLTIQPCTLDIVSANGRLLVPFVVKHAVCSMWPYHHMYAVMAAIRMQGWSAWQWQYSDVLQSCKEQSCKSKFGDMVLHHCGA